MKTKKNILILLLLSVFLIFESGCAIIHPKHRSGVTTNSYSQGKSSKGHKKKFTAKKSTDPFAPGKVKKHKKK